MNFSYNQMKKIYLSVLFLLLSLCAGYSQIGVNTEDPKQLFHIDPKSNTQSNDVSTQNDDVVITDKGTFGIGLLTPSTNLKLHVNGKTAVSESLKFTNKAVMDKKVTTERLGVGIGNTNPEALLHIENNEQVTPEHNPQFFRLSDTSERNGYMLTSDENGNAYWEALRPMSSVVEGSFKYASLVHAEGSEIEVNITKDSLKLVPGIWLVMANTTTTGALQRFTMYMRLYTEYGEDGDVDGSSKRQLITTSSTTEIYHSSNTSPKANPNLMFILNVPVPKKNNVKLRPGDPQYLTRVWIELATSGTNAVHSTPTGNAKFYAIRLDRQH